MTTPNVGQVWQAAKGERRVEILDLLAHLAYVRDVDTGRTANMDVMTFHRRGWTLVSERKH